jgi:hypothetical protein
MAISIIQDRLDKYFKIEEYNVKKIFNQLSLYIYYLESRDTKKDLYVLAKILPEEYLSKVISYFDGDIIKMPTKAEYKESYVLALCYYLKEIKQWSWVQIKEFLSLPDLEKDDLSSIKIGKKINKIKEEINKNLLNIIQSTKIEDEDFIDIVKGIKNGK